MHDLLFIQPKKKDLRSCLDSWSWLPIGSKTPILLSAFGDIFFHAENGVWFLDTLEGTLGQVCNTREELLGLLGTEEGSDTYLLSAFVQRANQEGMRLGEGECYGWKLHPSIGGEFTYENMEPRNFIATMMFRSQIHQKLKGLLSGSKISHFTVDGEVP